MCKKLESSNIIEYMRRMAEETSKWPEWKRRARLMDKDRQYKPNDNEIIRKEGRL